MTQQQYLTELQRRLRWWFSREEMADILGDYAEYFEQGAAQGRSEQELCDEFGPPAQIVRDLRAEHIGRRIRLRWFFPLVPAALLLALLLQPLSAGILPVWTLCLPPLLFAARRAAGRTKPLPRRALLAFDIACAAYIPVLAALFFWGVQHGNERTGPILNALLWVGVLLLLGAWGARLLGRGFVRQAPGFLDWGAAQTLLQWIWLLRQLDDMSWFVPVAVRSMGTMVIGLALSLLAGPVLRRIGEKA